MQTPAQHCGDQRPRSAVGSRTRPGWPCTVTNMSKISGYVPTIRGDDPWPNRDLHGDGRHAGCGGVRPWHQNSSNALARPSTVLLASAPLHTQDTEIGLGALV